MIQCVFHYSRQSYSTKFASYQNADSLFIIYPILGWELYKIGCTELKVIFRLEQYLMMKSLFIKTTMRQWLHDIINCLNLIIMFVLIRTKANEQRKNNGLFWFGLVVFQRSINSISHSIRNKTKLNYVLFLNDSQPNTTRAEATFTLYPSSHQVKVAAARQQAKGNVYTDLFGNVWPLRGNLSQLMKEMILDIFYGIFL